MDGSRSCSDRLFEYAFLSSGGFQGLSIFFEARRCATTCGLTVEPALPISTLPAKPINHFDPLTPCLLHTSPILVLLKTPFSYVCTCVCPPQQIKTREDESCNCAHVLTIYNLSFSFMSS